MEKQLTLGFALGSGGSRGIAHIGFLKAMEEAGIKPNFISGCSMGSVVGSLYASGVSIDKMKESAFALKPKHIIKPTLLKGALFDANKMREPLNKFIKDITFENLKIPFRCVATNMRTKELVTFSTGKVIDAVVASSSIPGIFTPTVLNNMLLVDGGVIERVPIKAVKELGADIVVGVDVMSNFNRLIEDKNYSAMQFLLATIDVMDNEITKRKINENKKILNLLVTPELGNLSPYSFKNLEFIYNQGYIAGKAAAPKIKKLLQIK